MSAITAVVVLGVLGGLVLAAIVVFLGRRHQEAPSVIVASQLPLTTDVINMGQIRVAGIGGLGLVAMAAAVALDVPRIGQSIAVGFGFGLMGAVVVIAWRRRTAPLPSSGRSMGANTVLSIDSPSPR